MKLESKGLQLCELQTHKYLAGRDYRKVKICIYLLEISVTLCLGLILDSWCVSRCLPNKSSHLYKYNMSLNIWFWQRSQKQSFEILLSILEQTRNVTVLVSEELLWWIDSDLPETSVNHLHSWKNTVNN